MLNDLKHDSPRCQIVRNSVMKSEFSVILPSHKKVVEADDAINLGHINLGSLHNAAIGSLDHSFPMSIPACFILLVLLSVFCPSSLLDFFSRLVPALKFQHPFCATII